jgi:hypothetical protein
MTEIYTLDDAYSAGGATIPDADFRTFHRSRLVPVAETVAEFNGVDWNFQKRVYVASLGVHFVYSATSLAGDDGVTVLHDSEGRVYSRDTAPLPPGLADYYFNIYGDDENAAIGLLADRSTHDAKPRGFAYFTTDTFEVYAKLSNTSADWSAAVSMRGPSGGQGVAGARGATGGAFPFAFSTTVNMVDPGAGVFRLNNATPALATAMAIDALQNGGGDVSDALVAIMASTSTVKARVVITTATARLEFNATAITDNGGWLQLTLANGVAVTGSLANGAVCEVALSRTGQKGDTGATGSNGAGVFDGYGAAALAGSEPEIAVLDYNSRTALVRSAANPAINYAGLPEGLGTFTRASEATFVGANGLIQTAPSGVLPYQHDPIAYRGGAALMEGSRTNLMLGSDTPSTQSVVVTAQAYTLSFTGTGTITLSGASTAGPLVGTGAGYGNRVSLTFTPSAGTLTLTVSGSVTNAQLEAGLGATSYIPTTTAAVTRAAATHTIPFAAIGLVGAQSLSVIIQMRALNPRLSGGQYAFQISEGTNLVGPLMDPNTPNWSTVYRDSAGTVSTIAFAGVGSINVGQTFRYAVRISAANANVRAFANGVAQNPNTYGVGLNLTSAGNLRIAPTGLTVGVEVDQVIVAGRALSDAELIERTTL